MQILLTNDDGIDAAGLRHLADALKPLGRLTVVAPVDCRSCCSHSITTSRQVSVEQLDVERYRVAGFPADCIRIALSHLGLQPDLVISGINHGANVGLDIWTSGTIAAAREASFHGVPAVAISQYLHQALETCWVTSARWSRSVLERILEQGGADQPAGLWNVNLPVQSDASLPEPEIAFCQPDDSPMPITYHGDDSQLRYRSNFHERPRRLGSDIDHCFTGRISVSRLA
jgi:5'-nucleotidase